MLKPFTRIESADRKETAGTGARHGYWVGRYGTWTRFQTLVRQYPVGTLVVDLVDVRQNVLAWEGVAQQAFGQDLEQVDQATINQVMVTLIEQFRARPGG